MWHPSQHGRHGFRASVRTCTYNWKALLKLTAHKMSWAASRCRSNMRASIGIKKNQNMFFQTLTNIPSHGTCLSYTVSAFVMAFGGNIFFWKTATSFFEHTSHIHRSSKITHAALNIKKNGFLSFCCCFDVCFDFEVLYWHDALWLLISVKTVWCFYLERINKKNDGII